MRYPYSVVLAIDTSTEICSVAVQSSQGEIIEAAHTQSTHHTQAVLPLIDQIISEAKLLLTDIDYIAVTVGPGSFTGVRAGIAVAQGLAYGLSIPVIPFGTLELVALGAEQHLETVHIVMDARMQQFYVASFNREGDKLKPTLAACLLSKTDLLLYLKKCLELQSNAALLGTGYSFIQDELPGGGILSPEAKNMIRYLNKQAAILDLSSMGISAIELTPIYIRDQVTN